MWTDNPQQNNRCSGSENQGIGRYKTMKVKSIQEAWDAVSKIFPYDYMKDESASQKAGYPIYYSTASEHPNNWISDLGTRLEVNFENGKSENIWIETEEYHHYEVEICSKSHVFVFKCSTMYEALEAVVDAGITFGFEVDTNKLMIDLVEMEQGGKISFSRHRYGIKKKAGEV